MEINKNIN